LITRPTVGPYFDQIFPPAPPTLGNWSVVEAYPSLTFQNPLRIMEVPGGIGGTRKMVVWEREGRVYLFNHESATSSKTRILDISKQCQGWDDSGLLGLAFHPDFGTHRQMFIWYI
jgi:hypothetical protein